MASTLVIACGAIAHELQTVLGASRWSHASVQCLPAKWHNTPERIAPAIESKIIENAPHFDRILIAYGDCGTGGQLDAVINRHKHRLPIERLPGNHCYDFFAGLEVFESLAEEALGSFYLTDYLAQNFDRLILGDLGITAHPELRDMYFAHYTRIVYLAQRQDPSLLARAESAAAALCLPLTVRYTGLAPLSAALQRIELRAV